MYPTAIQSTVYAKVPSATVRNMTYIITAAPDGRLSCACKGFIYRGTCRHLKEIAPAPAPLSHSCGLYCDDERDCLACQQAARS